MDDAVGPDAEEERGGGGEEQGEGCGSADGDCEGRGGGSAIGGGIDTGDAGDAGGGLCGGLFGRGLAAGVNRGEQAQVVEAGDAAVEQADDGEPDVAGVRWRR